MADTKLHMPSVPKSYNQIRQGNLELDLHVQLFMQ